MLLRQSLIELDGACVLIAGIGKSEWAKKTIHSPTSQSRSYSVLRNRRADRVAKDEARLFRFQYLFLPSKREVGRRYGFGKVEDVCAHHQTVVLLLKDR